VKLRSYSSLVAALKLHQSDQIYHANAGVNIYIFELFRVTQFCKAL